MANLSLNVSICWENQDEFNQLMENVAKTQKAYEEAIKAVQDFQIDMTVSTEYEKGGNS